MMGGAGSGGLSARKTATRIPLERCAMPDENEPLNADLLRRNESNRRINTILQALRTAPFADRIGIVGSVSRGKLTPVDLDIVVDVSDRRFEGPGQLSDFAVLLQLSRDRQSTRLTFSPQCASRI